MHLLPQYLPPVLLENSVLSQMEQLRSTTEKQKKQHAEQFESRSTRSDDHEKVHLIVNSSSEKKNYTT
jgi:hypothetical protein